MGHCGVNGGDEPLTEEARALYRMFSAYALSVADVNDGKNESVRQRTPKARVLFGLEYIQKLGG
jgi:hypothetical protein